MAAWQCEYGWSREVRAAQQGLADHGRQRLVRLQRDPPVHVRRLRHVPRCVFEVVEQYHLGSRCVLKAVSISKPSQAALLVEREGEFRHRAVVCALAAATLGENQR